MSGFSYQFHADPEELLFSLVPDWVKGLSVFVVAESAGRDFRRVSVAISDLAVAGKEVGVIDRVFVRLKPFQGLSEVSSEFMALNRGFLNVDVGRITPASLQESRIATAADDPVSEAAWRKVRSRAKRSMLRGAVIINPFGDRFNDKTHPYTPGALELYRAGMAMWSLQGEGVQYEFNPK